MYTEQLRKKFNEYMATNSSSLYRAQMVTGIHRQSIKKFMHGGGLTYENGMKMKKFIKDEIKFENETEFKPIQTLYTSSSE